MLKVYNYMTVGLVVTGIVAYGAFAMAFDATGNLTGFHSLVKDQIMQVINSAQAVSKK